MYGYSGRFAIINLSDGSSKIISPQEGLYRKYLGGRGFGGKILIELTGKTTDPLGEDNVVVIATGPLTGTLIPMNSRAHFVFKSPLTGGWGESSMGGSFPCYLKWSGYDALVITGKSEKPVYIHVRPDGIDIEDAKDIWGLDCYEAEKELVSRGGGIGQCRAIVIGPAGENLVRYACVTHGFLELKIGRGGQAGRTGVGAVFGSKKLKGIVVTIEEKSVEVADPEGVRELTRDLVKELVKKGARLREYGTSAMIDIANAMRFLPTRYWSLTSYTHIGKVSSGAMKESIVKSVLACTNCPIACGRLSKAKTIIGELTIEGPEYETLYVMGPLAQLDSLEHIVLINEYADKLGIDTISLGNVLAFAVEAYKRGALRTPYELGYGDINGYISLIEDIAYQKTQHGKILAQGVREASKALGVEDIAVHVRGLEPPGYDPRGLYSMYVAYFSSPRGACHLRTMAYMIDIRGLAGDPTEASRRKVETVIEWEDWCSLFDSLTLCKFGRDVYSFERMCEVLKVVTGVDYTVEHLKLIARRITTIAHTYERNVLGRGKEYDTIPKRLKITSEDGVKPIDPKDLDSLMKNYYEIRGFTTDGRVSEDTIKELDITFKREFIT